MALGISGALALGLCLLIGVLPHYYAPVTGLVLVLGMIGVRYLSLFHRQPRAAGYLILLLFALCFFAFTKNEKIPNLQFRDHPFVLQRQDVISRLVRQGARHLVIVHYAQNHNIHWEWVYNRANIDESDIVWARDMGEVRNRELLEYYHDRKVWLLEPDESPIALKPYPGS